MAPTINLRALQRNINLQINLCVAPVGKQLGCVCNVNNARLRRRHLYWPTLWRIGATPVFAAWRRCLRYVLLDVGAGFFHQRQHVDSSVNCSPDRLFSRFDFARSLRTAACAIKYQPIQTGMSALGDQNRSTAPQGRPPRERLQENVPSAAVINLAGSLN
jgi:hypothetical protein